MTHHHAAAKTIRKTGLHFGALALEGWIRVEAYTSNDADLTLCARATLAQASMQALRISVDLDIYYLSISYSTRLPSRSGSSNRSLA